MARRDFFKNSLSNRTGRLTIEQLYAWLAAGLLAVSSLFWALLGARLQQLNADQLVNSYLFENIHTLHGAVFPGSHTFLLKWPVFFLINVFGASRAAFIVFTILITLATVAGLMFILWRINRRPLILGTLALALASVLLLIPPTPYPGALLPVNMAMITTRNLEYLLYVGSLALLVRAPRIKHRDFWLALGGLSLLIASDKLFLTLSLGGVALALLFYAWRRASPPNFLYRWLALSLGAIAVSAVALWLINLSHLTHISAQANSQPYGLVHGARPFALALIFGSLGLLTNFGANPVFDTTIIRNMPHQFLNRVTSFDVIPLAVNFLIFLGGVFVIYRLLRMSFGHKRSPAKLGNPTKLSMLLIWSSVAAFGAFIFTNHYYSVDERYLTIALFTGFIAAAAYLRSVKLTSSVVLLMGAVLSLSVLLGMRSNLTTYQADRAALASFNERNQIVADIMKHHPADYLVGDYWRVLPIKETSHDSLKVMPLAGCNLPLNTLSSKTWQPDLQKHSFAYLLTLDKNLTNYKSCALDQVITAYGRPNSSSLIAGRLEQPQELVLFYDRGVKKSAPGVVTPKTTTVLPIPLSAYPTVNTQCPAAQTVVSIVAHQDDDLLFMNPDLVHSIKASDCIRSIYLTAGDAGSNRVYWESRERGSEAAYQTAVGSNEVWVERTVKLADQNYVRIANIRRNTKISLIFFRLPDGNLFGQGFAATHFESLQKLEVGQISQMHAVDGQSVYTSDQLKQALITLMYVYHPAEIRTQATFNAGKKYTDHSDHLAAGRYAQRAYQQYDDYGQIPINFYIGYPVRERPPNVFGKDFDVSWSMFDAYNNFDSSVCQTLQVCNKDLTYGSYLRRQYVVGPHS